MTTLDRPNALVPSIDTGKRLAAEIRAELMIGLGYTADDLKHGARRRDPIATLLQLEAIADGEVVQQRRDLMKFLNEEGQKDSAAIANFLARYGH